MRTLRQVLYGCKKHNYRFFGRVRWYEDEYRDGMRSKWICTNCMHIIHMKMNEDKL